MSLRFDLKLTKKAIEARLLPLISKPELLRSQMTFYLPPIAYSIDSPMLNLGSFGSDIAPFIALVLGASNILYDLWAILSN
jgi:hypothetical protein